MFTTCTLPHEREVNSRIGEVSYTASYNTSDNSKVKGVPVL